jgi:hypothetical protein
MIVYTKYFHAVLSASPCVSLRLWPGYYILRFNDLSLRRRVTQQALTRAATCSTVVSSSFQLQTTKNAVPSFQHSEYILARLAENRSQIKHNWQRWLAHNCWLMLFRGGHA